MEQRERYINFFTRIVDKKFTQKPNNQVQNSKTATFKTRSQILLIVKPANINQAQSCIKLANRLKVSIYPISCGKNWGYGSMTPPKDAVVLDLSRLNKIIDYSEELAYVTVEPGVTFRQLFEFLKKKRSNLMIETTGASPEASLIGSVVERGIGRGFYPKRNDYVAGFEVVLPSSKVIRTGFGQFGESTLAAIFKEGVGPDPSGLFLQSNLGIITKMTIWLAPLPNYLHTFSFYLKHERHLIVLVDRLRKLKHEGIIRGSFFLANDYKILSNRVQYPWKEMQGKTPLVGKTFEKLKQKYLIEGEWFGEGILGSINAGDSGVKIKRIKELLSKVVTSLNFSTAFPGKMIYLLSSHKINIPGVPSEAALPSMYWRKKTPVPKEFNPETDGCGVIWIGLVSPLLGIKISMAIRQVKKIIFEYGFEPSIGINLATDRAVYMIVAILFDREIREDDKQAIDCYEAILKQLSRIGIYPYRLSIHSMDFFTPAPDYLWFIQTLKNVLDPNHILSPGRYDFGMSKELL